MAEFRKEDAPLNIKQQNVIWFTREHYLYQAGQNLLVSRRL